ncbi:unnamed protein product, partial [Larinioides sclopetarius]
MPGITVCNENGFKPNKICDMGKYCSVEAMLRFLPVCEFAPAICLNGQPMPDLRAVTYIKFF